MYTPVRIVEGSIFDNRLFLFEKLKDKSSTINFVTVLSNVLGNGRHKVIGFVTRSVDAFTFTTPKLRKFEERILVMARPVLREAIFQSSCL